jgi:hypothetical protein
MAGRPETWHAYTRLFTKCFRDAAGHTLVQNYRYYLLPVHLVNSYQDEGALFASSCRCVPPGPFDHVWTIHNRPSPVRPPPPPSRSPSIVVLSSPLGTPTSSQETVSSGASLFSEGTTQNETASQPISIEIDPSQPPATPVDDPLVNIRQTIRGCRIIRLPTNADHLVHEYHCITSTFLLPKSQIEKVPHLLQDVQNSCSCAPIFQSTTIVYHTCAPVQLNFATVSVPGPSR